MAIFDGNGMTSFGPGRVLLGKSSGTKPYLMQNPQKPITSPMANPSNGVTNATTNQGGTGQVQRTDGGQPGPEAVRASGTGPFDPAYRQNLATFAGGQFVRPNGALSFNPTGKLDDLFGTPTGAGNAPVMGMPNSLLSMALGGQPFNTAPQPQQTPQPDTSGSNTPDPMDNWRNWLRQWNTRGVGGRIFGDMQ